ncbi:class I glutamine amidotransferase-like protein [Phaeosphaeriaceae sp. SRC1lsM3a]|nr:class I glutamine amidotransferase-like protein [Stagonospora sp. SRC1lsM3a]
MSAASTNTTQKPLRVGVLYEEVQMSDLIGLDLLGYHTPKVMAINVEIAPQLAPLMEHTTPMDFHYISSSLPTTWVTPAMNVQPTHTYETAPRDLDILVIGGPNPGTVPEASLTFLREAAKQTKIILTTCTGGMWLAKSGVLDGKKATTNRQALEVSKQFFPKVEWLDQRWVIEDGLFEGAKIWTGGGAGCGESSSLSILIYTGVIIF